MSPWVQGAITAPEIARGWKDDLLRLLFACCHPSLDTGESAALAHLVRGALLEELGRDDEAIASLDAAASHARNEQEARQIRARIARLREKGRS